MELRKYLLFLIGFNTAIIGTMVGKVKRVWDFIGVVEMRRLGMTKVCGAWFASYGV